MPKVKEVLARKGHQVATIGPGETALEAARQMSRRMIGSLVVLRGETVVGIVTERDILRKMVVEQRDPASTPVEQIMSCPVAVCSPEMELGEVSNIMTNRRIRHLPVVSEGRMRGIVTIGDVLAHRIDQQEVTIQYLHEYLYSPPTPHG